MGRSNLTITTTNTSSRGVPDRLPRPILKRQSTQTYAALLGSARFVEQQVIPDSHPTKPRSDMAASFLQFCAMCEKQIMTPSNAILYCSEACRRKDSCKPLSAASITTTPSITPPSSEPSSPRISFASPFAPRRNTIYNNYHESIPSELLHDHESDLDPTEWKPKIERDDSSDAFRYLARFHRDHSTTSVSDTSLRSVRREEYSSMASTPATNIPTPSLRHTPTTTAASSLSTSVSVGFTGSFTHHGHDCRVRPLPRQDKWYGLSHGTPKGIDLVTPHIAPASSAPHLVHADMPHPTYVEGRRLSWEKRRVTFAPSSTGDEGLSVLFSQKT